MADFADAFQGTNPEITAVTQVTAPTSSLGQQFGPGENPFSMDFAPNFSIYGPKGTAWFNSSTNTGGANSQLSTSYITIDYVLPGQEFHASRYWSPSNEMRTASYRNTVNPNVTVLSDYRFESGVGTSVAAGIGYVIDERHYVESIIARNTPTNGPATSAALIRGALRSKNFGQSWVFDVGVTNDIVNANPTGTLIPDLDVPIQTPWMWRGSTLIDYNNLKNSVWSGGVLINY